MSKIALTPEQELEAERLLTQMRPRAEAELREIARLMASKPTEQLLGQTEFQIRDLLLRVGAAALDTALRERKKGGTEGPPPAAPNARRPANSLAIARAAC